MYRLIGLALCGLSALVTFAIFGFVQQTFGWLPIAIFCGALVLFGLSFDAIRWWKESRSPSVWSDLDLERQYYPPLRPIGARGRYYKNHCERPRR